MGLGINMSGKYLKIHLYLSKKSEMYFKMA